MVSQVFGRYVEYCGTTAQLQRERAPHRRAPAVITGQDDVLMGSSACLRCTQGEWSFRTAPGTLLKQSGKAAMASQCGFGLEGEQTC